MTRGTTQREGHVAKRIEPVGRHKFSVGGHEGCITTGTYEDGTAGEIFLTEVGKEGSTIRPLEQARRSRQRKR